MTLVKASLWLSEQAAKAHWISVRDTGLPRNAVGQRWRNLCNVQQAVSSAAYVH